MLCAVMLAVALFGTSSSAYADFGLGIGVQAGAKTQGGGTKTMWVVSEFEKPANGGGTTKYSYSYNDQGLVKKAKAVWQRKTCYTAS